MKRSWAALAVAVVAILCIAGCNDYGSTFQNNTGAQITSLSPSNVNAGSGDFQLVVNGGGFVAKTLVTWNNKKLDTTVTLDVNGNVTMISAKVPAALVANPGTATVITLNPFSGSGNNGLSNALSFQINPKGTPLPAITTISPTSAPAGSPSVTLTIAGPAMGNMQNASFVPTTDPSGGSVVNFNLPSKQVTLPTSMITTTQITATIDASLLVNDSGHPITAVVTVTNPPTPPPAGCTFNCTGTGGGTSNGVNFTIGAAGAQAAKATANVAEEAPAVSGDGRYVSYIASQDGHTQTFLRDTCEGAASSCQVRTMLLSVAEDGTSGNNDSHSPSMSSDGRYVAFSSAASNLATGAPTGRQIYLRDTCLGVAPACTPSTQLVSTDASGALTGTEGILPSVSTSGRFVAFVVVTPSHTANQTAKTNSTAGTIDSGYRQVFVRDTCLGTSSCTPKTTRISLEPGSAPASGGLPAGPALSGGGKNVALAGAGTTTLFTRSVAIDDRVFLALTNPQ
jgi:hypothetical protein